MIYDAVVIGAGVAGLTAALRLAEEGAAVAVVSKGVGSIQVTGGTIDVLGYAPDVVDRPRAALERWAAANPAHPYAVVGGAAVEQAVGWFKRHMDDYPYVGDLERNFLLPSAAGVPRPTAVAPETMAAGDVSSGGRFALVGIRGFKDFYPGFAAGNLAAARLPSGRGITARAIDIDPPLQPRVDAGAMPLARLFDDRSFRGAVVDELGPKLRPGEAVGFPAVLGLEQPHQAWDELQSAFGAPVFEIPTPPPSIPGMRLFARFKDALRKAGARLVIGPEVVGATTAGRTVESVDVGTAGRTTAYRARSFVLATGGWGGGGLHLDSHWRAHETIFGLALRGDDDRGRRFGPSYFDRHPLNLIAVPVDAALRPLDGSGEVVYDNVHVAGAALGGAQPWREKSGDGVSLSTGYAAAGAILEEVK